MTGFVPFLICIRPNHVFCSMIAYVKLELLKIKHRSNHFAIKGRLYLKAIQAIFIELQNLKPKGMVLALGAEKEMLLSAARQVIIIKLPKFRFAKGLLLIIKKAIFFYWFLSIIFSGLSINYTKSYNSFKKFCNTFLS